MSKRYSKPQPTKYTTNYGTFELRTDRLDKPRVVYCRAKYRTKVDYPSTLADQFKELIKSKIPKSLETLVFVDFAEIKQAKNVTHILNFDIYIKDVRHKDFLVQLTTELLEELDAIINNPSERAN